MINSVTSDLKMQRHAITYICILVLFMKKPIIIISPTNMLNKYRYVYHVNKEKNK